ncbi:glucan endo-1,3-beta-glucosidase 12-like [Chenopodium quinoa]|uniref:glucan endo-1,3-beta-glucosidase 12-like n=1 Tax=Chenopodium quinoa TaxID=63459 RepID=UPI000B7797A5|nr:glucan endo-1,3-beta-glucosidase 12-like [Chenopodium quinoa]
MVVKMACLFLTFSILLLCFTVATINSAEILTVHSDLSTAASAATSMAVSVHNQDLTEVSNSVLMAETWLRNHVLQFYPTYNITHIVVGHNLLCSSKTQQQNHNLVLPALKNLHHSLTRWGLHSEIKVSTSFSSHCLELTSDSAFSLLQPLLQFIHSTNSSYMINPSSDETPIFYPKFESLALSHLKSLKKFGFSSSEDLNFMVVSSNPTQKLNPTMRKLTYILPTPSPEELPTARGPGSLPPLVGVRPTISPPSPNPGTPHFGLSPTQNPPSHPHHHHHYIPPCYPAPPQAATPPAPPQASAPTPAFEPREKLWCVAKPSVPAETLQEAMDYACGEGGAECDEIQPNGNCYFPDSLVSHASYAFNSYWQKNKINGGTCDFGGTAMLINSDPSFLQCKFIMV